MPPLRRFLLACLALAAPAAAGAQATQVENTAQLTYRSAAGTPLQSVRSNTLVTPLERTKRPTTLSFRLLPVGFQLTGLRCETDPQPHLIPAQIDQSTLAAAPPLAALDVLEPLIIVLDAQAENRDPTARETVSIDVQTNNVHAMLPLLETGPDTGVFAAGVPPINSDPDLEQCDIDLGRGEQLQLSYGGSEASYGSSAAALVDPAGYVFDSHTAQLVDGTNVTLVDDATGEPAAVYGDDGASRYPSTVVTGHTVTDAGGRVYPAQTGRYRFPFVAAGTYRLLVTPPGDYTAPSTVDRATLARLRGPDGKPFIITNGSFEGPLAVEGKKPVYTDIPLDRPTAQTLLLAKAASQREASPGDFVQYQLTLTNRGSAPATGVAITDTLPTGLHYRAGSTRGAPEPSVSPDGRQLVFAPAPIAAAAAADIRYVVSIDPGAPVGETVNRASAIGDGIASNEADAAVRVRALLFSDAMTIIGRVTAGDCGDPASHRRGVPGIRLLMEDGTFVVTDRDGLYHLEGVRAGRHVVQLDTGSVPASLAPVACDNDTRQAGSAISRFVEGSGGLLRRVDFQLRPTGRADAAADALPIAAVDDATAAGADRDWLAGQQPGIGWLFPAPDHNPRAPALRVVVKHHPGQRVALTINGQQPDPLAFDATDTDGVRDLAASRWSGIPLAAGVNHLAARVLNADGSVAATLTRDVVVSGAGVRAAFDPAHSRLVADGLTRPLIAVRVTDKEGRPVRAGTLVPFRVDAPYTAAVEAALEQGRQLAGREKSDTVARVVGDDGIAFLALTPTTHAGAVHASVTLADDRTSRVSDVRAWLAASARRWTVVGFGAGSLGYETLKSRSSAIAGHRGVVTDGQVALYAKGRIKGQWLLTLAYDSNRAYDPDRGLLGVIHPDRYYTVYGDGTQQGYDAPTRGKLYLRLERRQAYALFGDFESGLTDAQLTRYSRTLNGAKAAYEGRHLRATGIVAKTDQRYARDEIQGGGLSGPYRLHARGLVPNSDKVTIEVRDRFRPEKILSSTAMTRHLDYDIDPDLGTLRFREPVLSRDAGLNPIFIVIDYEVEGTGGDRLAAAGRVAASLAHDRVDLGVAAILDETGGAAATVLGADLKAKLNRTTELRGEVAAGGEGGLGAGLAYLAEAEHHGRGLDLLGYVRRQDARFGVGQQNFVEAGTQKIGLEGRVAILPALSLAGTAWYQDMLDSPATRTAADVKLEYRRPAATLFIGAQLADDRGLDGGDRSSRLLTLGGSKVLLGGRLTLAGQTQVAPGGDHGSVDFPIRHQVTAAYQLTPAVRVLGGYEIADGEAFVTHTAQVGLDLKPWAGAALSGTINQQAVGENGERTFAVYGLHQSLPLGRHWTIDATLDSSTTVRGSIPAGAEINAFQPAASGGLITDDQRDGDYLAVTLGATYRAALWSVNGRLEYRNATAADRWGVTFNALRTLGEGRTLAGSVKAYTIRQAGGASAVYADADLALAWRPLDSRWAVLDRFELRHERADAGITDSNVLGLPALTGGDQVTSRAINNLAVSYRTGPEGLRHAQELTFYYGAKYVRGRYADETAAGYIDVTGAEWRHDIGRRIDIGVQGSAQHAWSTGSWAWSGGPSAGVSPAGNLWLSAGYNVAGFRDRDFEADRYTRQGPYVTLRLKLDQTGIADAAHALFGGRR